ncbi:MAG: hypothetical protein AAF908_05000, partial [Pseudomonadota bacterium]
TGASSGQTNVIFNVFSSDPGAPTVEIASSGAFGLLAPTADVQIGNGNAGFVVGNSLDQDGQIRLGTNQALFTGVLPPSRTIIPLPAPVSMLLSGLAVLGAVGIRRRRLGRAETPAPI